MDLAAPLSLSKHNPIADLDGDEKAQIMADT